MNKKKLLITILAAFLACSPLAKAGIFDWAAGLSIFSTIPVLVHSFNTKNTPLALGYTALASLATIGFLYLGKKEHKKEFPITRHRSSRFTLGTDGIITQETAGYGTEIVHEPTSRKMEQELTY